MRASICLVNEHTYVQLPSCREITQPGKVKYEYPITALAAEGAKTTAAVRTERRAAEKAAVADSRSGRLADLESSFDNLDCFCPDSDRSHALEESYVHVDAHWNIPGAQHSMLLVSPEMLYSYNADMSQCSTQNVYPGDRHKVLGELEMHPVCQWGILRDLASVYMTGARASAIVEKGDQTSQWQSKVGVIRGLASVLKKGQVRGIWRKTYDTFKDRGGAAEDDEESLWSKGAASMFAGRANFVSASLPSDDAQRTKLKPPSKALQERLHEATIVLTENLDWSKMLDCRDARPSAEVLRPACVGKVCWNFVLDFRALYCTSWTADAAAMPEPCSLQDGACCGAIAESHAALYDGKADAATRTQLSGERLSRLEKAKALLEAQLGVEKRNTAMYRAKEAALRAVRKELPALLRANATESSCPGGHCSVMRE